MATEKNITMKQFNGTDYDTLYPKTKVEQVEGAYTQQQILADSTKTLYGLDATAVPDDVLALIKTLIDNGDASANANANSRAKIATGSYRGVGTYGSSNQNTLTFSFTPLVLIIKRINSSGGSGYDYVAYVFINPGTIFLQGSASAKAKINVSWTSNSISWYSSVDASSQYNGNGDTYAYVAFG